MGQFNRQSQAQWLNNISMMKNKTNMRATGQQLGKPRQQQTTQNFTEQENDLPSWDHHILDTIPNGQQTTDPVGLDIDSLVPDSPMQQQQQQHQSNPTSPNLNSLQPSLRGVKVPDEDLTPQQRQHRDEQLATLRKMQNLLFPEQDSEIRSTPDDSQQQKMMSSCNLINQQQQQQMRPIGPVMMGQRPQVVGNMCRPMGPAMMQENMMNDLMNCGQMSGGTNHMMNHQQQSQMMSGGMVNMSMSGGGGVPSMVHQQQMMGGGGGGMMNMNQCMSPGVMQGHKRQMMGPQSTHGTNSVAAQIEWHKLQHEYYEERKIKPGDVGRQLPGIRNQGVRLQGPPPPYHQTTRSASVPIATQSPNPGSPNNPTSNLSLPSPRPGSTLSSPADPNRPQQSGFKHLSTGQSPTSQDSPQQQRNLTHSNPSTPISSNLSPNASLKDVENSTTGKEPNLMPVPSPQQIQYLNTFEGQELTIQKQPNTSLKDTSISPS